jgi:hypothetical protein
MKKLIANVLIGIVAFGLVASIGYGGWCIEKWLNYKFSYESQVQEQMAPLEERVVALEKRVAELEKKP